MTKYQISKGYRKYIRQEKARIRREILDLEGQKQQIKELYERITRKSRKI